MKARAVVRSLQLAAALSAASMAAASYGCGGGSDAAVGGTKTSAGSPSSSASSTSSATTPDASTASGPRLPADEREVTFPTSMTDWGWMDVTQGGAAIGCPDALPDAQDEASITQTTTAIQCRLNGLGIGSNPGALFFPAGTYFIDQALSLTQFHHVTADGGTSLVGGCSGSSTAATPTRCGSTG
jgi:hypothetical protein